MSEFAPIEYPHTHTVDQVDNYHGHIVADPYRWLEDDTSADTHEWVLAQNKVTAQWLGQVPFRERIRDRLAELLNYPRISQPEHKHNWLLFTRNDGLQNQAVFYIQDGLNGTPDVLLDPNTMSADGTTRVGILAFDRSGERIAYTRSASGSDWQEIRVLHTRTREELADRVNWVKVSGIAWFGDGFFYSRYPTPGDEAVAYSSMNEDHQVFFHRLGTSQDADTLIYHDTANPQRFHTLTTTEDERYAILNVSDRGKGSDGNAVLVRDLRNGENTFVPIWSTFEDQMSVIDNVGDKLLVQTNRGAPNNRVVLIDIAHPAQENWTEIVAEASDPLESASTCGGKLFVSYMKDVSSRVLVYSLDGTLEREIALPSIGTAGGFGGGRDVTIAFYTFTSFTAPPTVYKYDIATGVSTTFTEPQLPFNPDAFHATQIFVPSRDGTRIPAFVVSRKDIVLDGNNPTIVYGYGGFNVSLLPTFSAARVAFLEQGGVFVQANLRGGGEYGESWHQAGMKEKKQNVFDDAIAVIEWLVEHKYTNNNRVAIQGGSNGGLLAGAIMTQRPELVRVALPAVGVLDMLRFHKFTIGWNWIADYGSSEDEEGFKYLSAYSPLQNIRDGVSYPATMITTADHDDRVVPAHSFKFAARLQAAHRGSNPVLIRIETKSGHGASSLTKGIEELTDVYAFVFANMGVTSVFVEA